jgi:hAT family C-terminal dimerisation region
MFLDNARSKGVPVRNVQDCVDFAVTSAVSTLDMLPEFAKLLQITLTISMSSCCAERSFSVLRRIKTNLRATKTQTRLNSAAVLHVHRDMSEAPSLSDIADEFNTRVTVRQNTFATSTRQQLAA